jgi:hypothetical protein
MGGRGSYQCFCLDLVDYLIPFGVKIISGLILFQRLQKVLGNEGRRIVSVLRCLLQTLLILIVRLHYQHMGLLIINL